MSAWGGWRVFKGVASSDDPHLTSQREKGKTMSKIDEIKADIERLPGEEVAELYRWLSEKEWESWDKEIESDSEAGKLDFLVREAREEKAKGTLKEM
jgi:putative aminopeptidase FrvX